MLKKVIQTLEINTTGSNLSLVQTIFINIKQGNNTTVKSNNDIEIRNSVISVSLTQEESDRFKQGNSSISINAIGYDGESYKIQASWVKLGNRTDSGTTGSSASGSSGEETEMTYDETLDFLNGNSTGDIQTGNVLSYDATMDILNS